jgi:di/tricarboxylate transporter
VIARTRTTGIYLLVTVVGVAAFLYPFWLPSDALPARPTLARRR